MKIYVDLMIQMEVSNLHVPAALNSGIKLLVLFG
jgi:hypothetical protein